MNFADQNGPKWVQFCRVQHETSFYLNRSQIRLDPLLRPASFLCCCSFLFSVLATRSAERWDSCIEGLSPRRSGRRLKKRTLGCERLRLSSYAEWTLTLVNWSLYWSWRPVLLVSVCVAARPAESSRLGFGFVTIVQDLNLGPLTTEPRIIPLWVCYILKRIFGPLWFN